MNPSVGIIGAGISGLSAAAVLAKEGIEVTVFEKNSTPGGRARSFVEKGFTFDMGPSWYWMPDVFDRFFAHFGKKVHDFYALKRLDPAYRIYFADNDYFDVPAHPDELFLAFETIEKGSSIKLKKFLKDAEYKYTIGIHELIYKPGLSLTEFADIRILYGLLKMDILKSLSKVIRSNFRHIKLIRLLEFPVLFLGATPWKTPALYSLMNYADLVLGTWYPHGGMYKIIESLVELSMSFGVTFKYSCAVSGIEVEKNKVAGLTADQHFYPFTHIIGAGDYHHIDQQLLPNGFQGYSEKYWESRVLAPSSLLIYLGINKMIPGLLHHNLFFDIDFEKHAAEIYENPCWPEAPALYVSCTSKSDESVAPEGQENMVILIPVAPGLVDTDEIREYYFNYAIDKIESLTHEPFRNNIVFKKMYSHRDFISDYNAFRGNAYGLANTLMQTAYLKPRIKSRKVKNMYFAGQLTAPGPGVPPSLVSGELVANSILNSINN